MKNQQIKTMNANKFTLKGKHIFTFTEIKTDRAKRIVEMIEEHGKRYNILHALGYMTLSLSQQMHEEYRYLQRQLREWTTKEFIIENLIVNTGLNSVVDRIAGVNTYSGNINYTALGTGTTAVSGGQTQLVAEVYRKARSSGTVITNTAYVETFFNPTEVTGTFEEYANFVDGSGTTNSGQMFNRFLQTTVKSSSESLNILTTIEANNA